VGWGGWDWELKVILRITYSNQKLEIKMALNKKSELGDSYKSIILMVTPELGFPPPPLEHIAPKVNTIDSQNK
jgi:hypothetical protein